MVHLLLIIATIFILFWVAMGFFVCESFINEIKKPKTQPELLDDKLFSDVKTFDNDPDGRLGLDKCLELCDGTCLEYGVTGIAHCFPWSSALGKNYYTAMRNFENENDDVDRAAQKLVYPSVR